LSCGPTIFAGVIVPVTVPKASGMLPAATTQKNTETAPFVLRAPM